jgi:hypothetical protein
MGHGVEPNCIQLEKLKTENQNHSVSGANRMSHERDCDCGPV